MRNNMFELPITIRGSSQHPHHNEHKHWVKFQHYSEFSLQLAEMISFEVKKASDLFDCKKEKE